MMFYYRVDLLTVSDVILLLFSIYDFFRSVETAKWSQVKLAKFQRIPRSPFLGKNDSASDNRCSE